MYPAEFLYPHELIKKEKNIYTKLDNMISLSYLIDDFIRKDHSSLLKELQSSLWDKYNKNNWISRII